MKEAVTNNDGIDLDILEFLYKNERKELLQRALTDKKVAKAILTTSSLHSEMALSNFFFLIGCHKEFANKVIQSPSFNQFTFLELIPLMANHGEIAQKIISDTHFQKFDKFLIPAFVFLYPTLTNELVKDDKNTYDRFHDALHPLIQNVFTHAFTAPKLPTGSGFSLFGALKKAATRLTLGTPEKTRQELYIISNMIKKACFGCKTPAECAINLLYLLSAISNNTKLMSAIKDLPFDSTLGFSKDIENLSVIFRNIIALPLNAKVNDVLKDNQDNVNTLLETLNQLASNPKHIESLSTKEKDVLDEALRQVLCVSLEEDKEMLDYIKDSCTANYYPLFFINGLKLLNKNLKGKQSLQEDFAEELDQFRVYKNTKALIRSNSQGDVVPYTTTTTEAERLSQRSDEKNNRKFSI